MAQIARALGVTRNSIIGKTNRLGLHFRGGRSLALPADHPAIIAGRSLFRGRISNPLLAQHLLMPGEHQRKLGAMVVKGRWKGFPLFSLSLEERATCPRSCEQFHSCFGNNMHNAKRFAHGPALIAALQEELTRLQQDHRAGFVVRLHLLGDFYSTAYVDFWAKALDDFPALRVFGYTHWQRDTEIGMAVAVLRDTMWKRFAVRTSDAKSGPRAVTVALIDDAKHLGAIICPAQLAGGESRTCGTCALCWATDKPIAFLQH